MAGFDIEALVHFQPCDGVCVRCSALLHVESQTALTCPICHTHYEATPDYPTVASWLATQGLYIGKSDLVAHAARLGSIAHHMRASLNSSYPTYPPMRALLESLAAAQHFIHFTTFGISALLLGALKLAALQVAVRGVVSGVKNDVLLRELTDYSAESPRLDLRVVANDAYFPHQKIVVIDGLMAFKGSANMTDFGWRKAAQGREVIEVVTDIAQVEHLHNRFFSPTWMSFADLADTSPSLPIFAEKPS